MTITLEPFAKLDAVCSGCGRSASVARVCFPFDRDRHIFCERCLADLHRLTAPTAPALTVGAALAMPEVQRGEAVVEFIDGACWEQVVVRTGRRELHQRWIDRDDLASKSWTRWVHSSPRSSAFSLPCRLVPVDLADRDPSERGAL